MRGSDRERGTLCNATNHRQSARLSSPPGAANRAPRYPVIAREKGWEGTVVLTVTVAADGSAQEVRIKHPSHHHALDAAALDAVRDWRFTPATRLGETVTGTIDVPVTFRLKE